MTNTVRNPPNYQNIPVSVASSQKTGVSLQVPIRSKTRHQSTLAMEFGLKIVNVQEKENKSDRAVY